MPTTRLITAAIAIALIAAALAGPAAAVPGDSHDWHYQPHSWYAGESTIQGSAPAGGATANVYVPPDETANVYVPPDEPVVANATTRAADPPTWPANPRPIARTHAVVNAPASGLDWGSAGIGGGAVVAAVAITLAGIVGVRRRRTARPRPLITR